MEERYFVKPDKKEDYIEIYNIAVKEHTFLWEDRERLDSLLKNEKPILWLVEINFTERIAKLIVSNIGCACLCSRYGEKILKTKDVEYLFKGRCYSSESLQSSIKGLEVCYHYSYKELMDGSLSLSVQSLDNMSFLNGQETISKYYFDRENKYKLHNNLSRLTNEKLELAILRNFFTFTHVENWFEDEEFEKYCLINDISFKKEIIIIKD